MPNLINGIITEILKVNKNTAANKYEANIFVHVRPIKFPLFYAMVTANFALRHLSDELQFAIYIKY